MAILYINTCSNESLFPKQVKTVKHINLSTFKVAVLNFFFLGILCRGLEPVIAQNSEIVQEDPINIQRNCGLDNICVPDLRLQIKTVDMYLLGSIKPLTIEVLVTNNGEDAFEATFYMVIPKSLDFRNIAQPISDTTVSCSPPYSGNMMTLKCELGNPLKSGKVVTFNIVMLPRGMSPRYDFYMEVNSTNLENKDSYYDNIIRKSIGNWVETNMAINGTSRPDYQLYRASDFKAVENAIKEEDLGPQVVHVYSIHNKGPSMIEEAVVLIRYPYQTIDGDLLMYVTNQPETNGNIQCDPVNEVNSLNLNLDTSSSAFTNSSSSSSFNLTTTSSSPSSMAATDATKQVDLSLETTKCKVIRCVVKNLGSNEEVLVAIRTRMVAKIMQKLAGNVPLNISTMAVLHVTRLPYIGVPRDRISRTHEIFYKAVPELDAVPDAVLDKL